MRNSLRAGVAIAGSVVLLHARALGQDPAPSPGGMTADGMASVDRVIVTGSNIPTADEVGPNPVDSYRRDDISRLGARTPSDFIQRIPSATGFGPNENNDATSRI